MNANAEFKNRLCRQFKNLLAVPAGVLLLCPAAASSVTWYGINVPTNADFATNSLIWATAPVNVWWSTNNPPTTTNANDFDIIPGATNGSRVLGITGTPNIVPGGSYLLGVENTNGFNVIWVVSWSFHVLYLPTIQTAPQTQTAEAGATVDFGVDAGDDPSLKCQWLFNGNAIGGCTNSDLCLSGVQATNVGTYLVIVSNIFGAVTSAPITLNVIPPVERRPVPGINLMGDAGSMLYLDFADSLSPAPNWSTLDSVTLTGTSELYFDLTKPLPPQRFYRAWQTGTPGVAPSLSLPAMIPAITLTGNIGDQLRLDCINQVGPTDAWVTLDTVTLTNTSQLYFDISAPGQPPRLYRIVPAP